jgi:glycosyltransferase involved in cell wall biosynthesis
VNPTPPNGLFSPPGAVRVAVDLTALAGGGASGGLKPFVFHLLQWICKERADEFAFIYFTRPGLVNEVEEFRRDTDWNVCLGPAPVSAPDPGWRTGMAWAPDAEAAWTSLWPADLLYTPWGFSAFYRTEIPSINLVADTLHRDWPGLLPKEEIARREEWFHRMIPLASAIQCNSEFVRQKLLVHFDAPPEKLFVIHNAIQGDIVAAAGKTCVQPPPKPYFFYPANDWAHKNHERLLRAYADYRNRAGAGAWDLVLCGHVARGDAWLPAIATLGIEGACRVLGYLDRQAFAEVFRNAGALVFPSLYEGFGIPVIEAMALGVPVTCSNLASIPEVAGKAALYFDPRRTSDIAGAMDRIGKNPSLRARLVEAGIERAKGFSISREAGLLADKFAALATSR